eukprot:325815-Amorphochlora_amoeboformis.AAC.1
MELNQPGILTLTPTLTLILTLTPPHQHSTRPTTRSAVIPNSTIAPLCGGVNGPRTKTCQII